MKVLYAPMDLDVKCSCQVYSNYIAHLMLLLRLHEYFFINDYSPNWINAFLDRSALVYFIWVLGVVIVLLTCTCRLCVDFMMVCLSVPKQVWGFINCSEFIGYKFTFNHDWSFIYLISKMVHCIMNMKNTHKHLIL